jgi:hypothetical protein
MEITATGPSIAIKKLKPSRVKEYLMSFYLFLILSNSIELSLKGSLIIHYHSAYLLALFISISYKNLKSPPTTVIDILLTV